MTVSDFRTVQLRLVRPRKFSKDKACLEEGYCPISTSLSIIPLLDKYDCV